MYLWFCVILILPSVFCGDVIKITSENKDVIKSYPICIVKYYAPWCGHCKKIAPEYEKAATTLKDSGVPCLEVNCDEEKEICNGAGITGFPTLKIYYDGENPEDYNGGRSADDIVRYMKSRAGPPSEEFSSLDKISKHNIEQPVITLQYSKDSHLEEFLKCARSLRSDLKFMHTKEKVLDTSKDSVVRLHRPTLLQSKLEEQTLDFDGKLEKSEISDWIEKNIFGRVGIRTSDNEKYFKKPLLVVYMTVDHERNPSRIRYCRNRVFKAAKAVESSLTFALSDDKAYSYEISDLGLVLSEEYTAVIRSVDGKTFVMKEKFSVDELIKFIEAYKAGKLEAFMKSEPVPTSQDEAVVKVVGKTFDQIVNDESKDVLIEFYAPWCGHCKSLEPKYTELAKKLSKESKVVIAKMDATANFIPSEFNVRGYPTIYFAKRGAKKEPELYNGEREVDAMLKFIASSAKDELDSYDRKGVAKKADL